MRSVFLLLVFTLFPILGFIAPYIAALGYLWIDIARPQTISYSLLTEFPISFTMFILALVLYVVFDRREPQKLNFGFVLLICFALWISLTTTWAEVPNLATEKWDWAVKGVIFGAISPFFFRSRIQIESAFAIINFSAASLYLSTGIVTIMGGGNYGNLTRGNSGIFESSTLSLIVIMLIPLNLYFSKHSLLFSNGKIVKLLFYTLILFCVATAIGTFARTGLVSGIVLVIFLIINRKKNKFSLIGILAILGLVIFIFSPESWLERMNTLNVSNERELETSALSRLAIWAWTLDYVVKNPFGGGFGVYSISEGEYFGYHISGRAFHSAYFEVLGGHGFIGLFIYGAIFVWVLSSLQQLKSASKKRSDLDWLGILASYVQISFIVYGVGSSFIGVAFQPVFYYFVGLTISLKLYYFKSTMLFEQRQPNPTYTG